MFLLINNKRNPTVCTNQVYDLTVAYAKEGRVFFKIWKDAEQNWIDANTKEFNPSRRDN